MEASTAATTTPAETIKSAGIRWKFLFWLAVVIGGLVFFIQRFGQEALGFGWDFRFVGTVVTTTIGVILALFLGGFSWKSRFAFLAVVIGGGWIVKTQLIRGIEFDGALVPSRIDWIWNPPPERPSFDSKPTELLGSWSPSPTNDFAEFRGPKRDGVSVGPALAREWKTKPPKLVWGPIPVGEGYGAFAAAGDHLVSLEQRNDREAIVCYRRDNGKEIWVHSYPAYFREFQGGDGPRSTPTVVGESIYSLGATGVLVKLDGRGKPLWTVNVLNDVGAPNLQWAMSGSPLVVDGMVIVNSGVGLQSGAVGGLVAYDAETGKRRWTSSDPRKAGYSSPQLMTVAGVEQVVIFDGHGIAGTDPKTGKQHWREPWPTNQGINVSQTTLIGGDQLFVTSGYMAGAALYKIVNQKDKWSVERLWKDRRSMQCKFTSPVLFNGHLYGFSDVELVCVDPKDGKRLWKGPAFGYGQVVLRDDLLIVLTEQGSVVLASANPSKYEELGRFDVFNEKTWNTPCLAGNRLYLRNHRRMACYELPTKATDLAANP
jgi:outer membrane protein assembly factor BamB